MELVERVTNIILKPKQEWVAIAGETHTVQGLFTGYVMILAAIPAVASFVGFSIVGLASYRVPIAYGVTHMVVTYVMSLAAVYVLALVIDALAPQFGGQKNFPQALKVAAFSPTASWLAGVFAIVPLFSVLSILGLYSLALLFLGLPPLMKAPEDKALPYTVVVIIAAIVIFAVVSVVAGLAIPSRSRGY